MPAPLRVAQVTTGLETGGAETVLARLVERLDRERIETVVVSLTTDGVIGPRLRAAGIEVVACRAAPLPGPVSLARIRSALRRADADVIQTWAIYANVLGGIGARLAGRAPVAWGVHHAGDDLAAFGRKLLATQRLERRLSFRLPAAIVACSQSSARMMAELRYPAERVMTIVNGFDSERFRPDAAARRRTRAELGIAAGEPVVGHVARFHPVKGHAVFAAAVRAVAARLPTARFVLCGAGVDRRQPSLADLAESLGDRALLLGERAEMAALYPAFDVCVSSSLTEALPLAVGEAMACAVPVVATDCGDSSALVGATGRIVPVGDPASLATAIVDLLSLPVAERARLGDAARRRIADHYSMAAMAAGYERLWSRLGRPDAASSRS